MATEKDAGAATPRTKGAGKVEETPPSPGEERLLSGLPFFFGGGLAVFFAYSLRDAPVRSGVPPLWILFLTLGIIALVAGVLLALSTEPDAEEEDEGTKADHVVVPKKEWEGLQAELSRLRGSSPKTEAKAAAPDWEEGDPPSSGQGPASGNEATPSAEVAS